MDKNCPLNRQVSDEEMFGILTELDKLPEVSNAIGNVVKTFQLTSKAREIVLRLCLEEELGLPNE
jgi:hypothetical protein